MESILWMRHFQNNRSDPRTEVCSNVGSHTECDVMPVLVVCSTGSPRRHFVRCISVAKVDIIIV